MKRSSILLTRSDELITEIVSNSLLSISLHRLPMKCLEGNVQKEIGVPGRPNGRCEMLCMPCCGESIQIG